ncbi:MAG: rod shape-determining protein MreD [Ignavibacteriales bacterium]|nr:rod shape-determining protein MreD [Ignavibacteriales bacterium]
MEQYFRSALVAVLLLLIQTTFIPYVSVWGYLPDIFIPWLVYVGLRRGQVEATVSGFAVGLLQDLVATKFLGLAALSKTLSSFIAGYFYNENQIEQSLGSYRYVLIVMLSSVVHNTVYFLIFFQGVEGSLLMSVVQASIGTTLYTGVISVMPMFGFSQRYHTSWAQ